MKCYIIFTIILSSITLNTGLTQTIRKNYNEMTSSERTAYVNALYELRTPGNDFIEELRAAHQQNMSQIHNDERFLPWHRMFVKEFETALRSFNQNLSVPYWNWVTDNSPNDPLWDQNFLGQFDVAWDLGRWLSGTLPTQSQVDNVQSITNFGTYRVALETQIHNNPHCWVGLIMCQVSNSPLDPVFYMHHGMIDKLWQEWEEVHGTSSFVVTSLPRYGIDPDNIVDSRALNVWYAENGVVMLDDYQTITGEPNSYTYTGKIESENFTVSSGTNVTFTAGTEIFLGAGFQVQSGSTFYADVDPDVGNLSKTRFAEEETKEKEMSKSFSLFQNYPNPFNPTTRIKYTLPVDAHVAVKVYDILGKEITEPVNEFKSAGEYSVDFNGSSLASGVYFYYIIAAPAGGQENFKQVKKMILAK